MKTPKLKRINLNLINDCNHPDINLRKKYMANIEGDLYVGKFSRHWYGLNFDCDWGYSGVQLDGRSIIDLWELSFK